MRLGLPLLLVVLVAEQAAAAPVPRRPCLAVARATAVFVGTTGPMVTRWDRLNGPDESPVEGRYVPVTVERVFRGVTTPVVYLTPAGVENHLPPGRRFLIYGWDEYVEETRVYDLLHGQPCRSTRAPRLERQVAHRHPQLVAVHVVRTVSETEMHRVRDARERRVADSESHRVAAHRASRSRAAR